jgi:hypothetical protein
MEHIYLFIDHAEASTPLYLIFGINAEFQKKIEMGAKALPLSIN